MKRTGMILLLLIVCGIVSSQVTRAYYSGSGPTMWVEDALENALGSDAADWVIESRCRCGRK